MNNSRTLPDECRAALADHLKPELFRALCDPNRLALVGRFAAAARPMTVTDAASCCGVHISGVSRHLAMLRDAGVLRATKHGREVLYELDSAALAGALRALADAIETCRMVCCSGANNQETGDEQCGTCEG